MTADISTFAKAQRYLAERFPMTPEETAECKRLDEQVHRARVAHLEHHREIGVETCYNCDWPMPDLSKSIKVTIANGMGIALCCREYCASRVRELIGAVE